MTNTVLQQEPLEGPGRDPALGHCMGAGQRARWIRTPLAFLQMTTALKGLVVCGLLCVLTTTREVDGGLLTPATHGHCSPGVCQGPAPLTAFLVSPNSPAQGKDAEGD